MNPCASIVDLFCLINDAKLKGGCRDKDEFSLTGGLSGIVPVIQFSSRVDKNYTFLRLVDFVFGNL